MEKETKACPYCGEEILAVARKCKHCGEWLEEIEEEDAELEDEEYDEDEEYEELTEDAEAESGSNIVDTIVVNVQLVLACIVWGFLVSKVCVEPLLADSVKNNYDDIIVMPLRLAFMGEIPLYLFYSTIILAVIFYILVRAGILLYKNISNK